MLLYLVKAIYFEGIPQSDFENDILQSQFTNYSVYEFDMEAFNQFASNRSSSSFKLTFERDLSWDIEIWDNHIVPDDLKIKLATESGVVIIDAPEIHTFSGINRKDNGNVRITVAKNYFYGYIEDDGEDLLLRTVEQTYRQCSFQSAGCL